MDGVSGGVRGTVIPPEGNHAGEMEKCQSGPVDKPCVQKPIAHYVAGAVNATSTYNDKQAQAKTQEIKLCDKVCFVAVTQQHIDSLIDKKKVLLSAHKKRVEKNVDYYMKVREIATLTLKQMVLEHLNGSQESAQHKSLEELVARLCDKIHPFTVPSQYTGHYELIKPELLWPVPDKYKSPAIKKREVPLYHPDSRLDGEFFDLSRLYGKLFALLDGLENSAPKTEAVPSDEDIELKMLACFQTARETNEGESNLIYIDFLKAYMHEIEDSLLIGYSVFDMQMVIVVWYYALARLFRKCFLHQIEDRIGKRSGAARGELVASTESRERYQNECVEMFEWSININFHRLATIDALSTISVTLANMHTDYRSNVKKLIHTYSMTAIETAKSDDNKKVAYTNYIIACDLLRDFASFAKVRDAATKYTLYPVFIMIWHDLGLRKNSWDSERMLNPEEALEHLEWLAGDKDMLDMMSTEVAYHSRLLPCASGGGLLWKETESSSYVILYYYLADQVDKAKAIAKSVGFKNLKVFDALVMAGKKKYAEAIECISSNRKACSQLNALTAILHEKVAEKYGNDERKRQKHLRDALDGLTAQAQYRKELLKPLARVQEKLDLIRDCLKSLQGYKDYLIGKGLTDANQEVIFVNFQIDNLSDKSPGKEKKVKAKKAVTAGGLHQAYDGSANAENEDNSSDINSVSISDENTSKPSSSEKPTKLNHRASDATALAVTGDKKNKRPDRHHHKERSAPVTTKTTRQVLSTAHPFGVTEFSDNGDKYKTDPLPMDLLPAIGEKQSSVTVDKLQIPDCLSVDIVDAEMAGSLEERQPLYDALIYSGKIDYKKLIERHDLLLGDYKNPVIQTLILQNKVWTLRKKTSDAYALMLDAHKLGELVDCRKIELHQEKLTMLFTQIETLSRLWTEQLPENWQSDPCVILKSVKLQQLLAGSSPRFALQLASLFTTIAHVMKEDLSEDQPETKEGRECAARVLVRNFSEYGDLYKKYYTCSKLIKRSAGL